MQTQRKFGFFILFTTTVSFAGACASVKPGLDYDRVSAHVETVIGQSINYRPGDEQAVQLMVNSMLHDGLTADEAVRVALLNNPTVWAALLRTGMARADVVQAGLFSNPTLGLSFKLPEGGGLTQFEMGLAQNIADLWMIPARTRAARRDLERTILETARVAAGIANDTRIAYFSAVGTQRALEIARENLKLVERLLGITDARLEAGTVGALDVNLVKGLALRAQVDERNARLAAATAGRTLATLLGLETPAEDLRLLDPLPDPAAAPIDPVRLVEIARSSRLDLRAARENVFAAEARVAAEYSKIFQNVEVGLDLERGAQRSTPGRKVLADTARASIANGGLTAPDIESRGQRRLAESERIDAILGPSLSVTLPLFDQNQAQIAKAKLALQEADALLESLQRTVAQETREAVDRVTTAWAVARLYDQEVLPQARTTLELSESAYQVGQTPILNVIEAQRLLLETRQAYVAALQSAASALVDLERATARPAKFLLQSTDATTQPAPTPSEAMPGAGVAIPQETDR